MKVIFSHGKESGPNGKKIERLSVLARSLGYSTESIDYRDLKDPDQRVERLVLAVKSELNGVILVGSSMGGYASLVASINCSVEKVFLLAPALYMPGYKVQSYKTNCSNIHIVHGWSDDVIPVENSIRFAKEQNCNLQLLAGDHRLNTSMNQVLPLFEVFLKE